MSRSTRLRNPALQNFAAYGLATGLAAVLTLILTRLLWRMLTPADFGVWSLVDPMLLPGASLVLLGIDHSIVKQLRVDGQPLRAVVGTLLASTAPASLSCLAIAGLVAGFLFKLPWTDALLLTMAGEALVLMTQTAFRAVGAVYHFAAVLLARNLVYLAVLWGLVAHDGQTSVSVRHVFLLRGICVMVIGLASLVALRPMLRFDCERYRDALRYGFPLLLTTFIYALTDLTDRWFLAEFTGVVAVGVYGLHLKVAAILSQAIVIPFGLWFPPERFKRLDTPDGGHRFFVRTAVALALVCSYLSGAVWLARELILNLIAPGAAVSPLILGCCLGSVTCLALSQALNVGLLLPGHTGKNAICTALSVVVAVLAAAILVPLFDADGAAASRLLGGLVLAAATAGWSNRIVPVAFPYLAMVLYFCTSAGIAACIDQLTSSLRVPGMISAQLAWAAATAVSATLAYIFVRRIETDGIKNVFTS